jgi:dCTP deaminase
MRAPMPGEADRRGAILVDRDLLELVHRGAIYMASGDSRVALGDGQAQPSSLDLRLGRRAWQLQCSFLPGARGIEEKIRRLAVQELVLDDQRPTVLQKDGVYLCEVEEALKLPTFLWGRANPKSSSGRLDVFVRLLLDEGHAFDTVPAGYHGRMFLEVTPQSFHVAVRRGDCLGQLRLARGRPRLGLDELRRVQAESPVVYWSDGSPAPVVDEEPPGIQMSVDLHEGELVSVGGQLPLAWSGEPAREVRVAGYAAERHRPAIDLRARGMAREGWWRPIPAGDAVVLEPEQFYIFATRERLRIPPELCAELVPFDATKGELRSHYAGFIDSGFGDDPSGAGARLVLEIRTRDVPFLLEHGQPLFRIELLRNAGRPDALYGGRGSSYQMQGLRLGKQFK